MATQATTKHLEVKARRTSMAGMILDRLQLVASGELDMTPNQIAAAKLYLAKTLPDLKAVEHSGETTTRIERIDVNIIK
jgi:hypothetical protein